MFKTQYQVCNNCVMDTSDKTISFDFQGECSHCKWYKNRDFKPLDYEELIIIAEKIKKERSSFQYDIIMGISGGVDSSYSLYLAVKKLKLRVLVVHFDNGWNSEPAVYNIEQLVKKLDIDLLTYIVDWEEFRDIQKSFIFANVIDIEAITDHALAATVFKFAYEYKIPYIFSGGNFATESIMPREWVYEKKDSLNILDIHSKYMNTPIKAYPHFTYDYYLKVLENLKFVNILNYVDYNKENAKEILKKEMGWKDYGGKHGESIFTKFYQNYILPEKFGVDKRKAHLSSLILSGQITRNEALSILEEPLYDKDELRIDKKYILKKLKITEKEFDLIMKEKPVTHQSFKNQQQLFKELYKRR